MQRGGEDARIIAEDQRRAVAMMDVAIDDRHTAHFLRFQQELSGNADIVEHAETRAAVGPGMMAAAGKVHSGPLLQSKARGETCAADRCSRAPGNGGRDLEPDLARGLRVQRLGHDGADIGLVMREVQPVFQRGLRRYETVARVAEKFGHERIFAHREAMVIGDRFRVIVNMVDNGQCHIGWNLAGFPPVSTYARCA